MNATINQDELLRLRMRAQGLQGAGAAPGVDAAVATGPERIAATASRMLAMQGQDWRSSRWALGVRSPGTTVADVYAAFNKRLIVRSWPMRGTIHVVAAEDIGWMQSLTNHRVLASAPKRRDFLGITDALLDRLVETSLAALANDNSLDRDELSTTWTEAGIEWQSAWRYHLIWWLCQNGLAVFGPQQGDSEPRLVLAEDWIQHPRSLGGDDALAELATRYAAARGPIRRKDLAWWSGLTLRETDRSLALAEELGRLVSVSLADNTDTLWVDPELLDSPDEPLSGHSSALSGLHLLPAFDEHLLGYTNRDAQIAPEYFEHIVPGKNGMFLATVVDDGRVVGTWKHDTRKRGTVNLSPFPGERFDIAAALPEFERWAQFYGFADIPLTLAAQHCDDPVG
ncbi:winged helix DNA-binding domain-containing protein [Leucobacter coleopterorum]|uniref:Winged helix DNA-binding domain-containing protein n=1 Tax=Leucobacter coleopterorum TaxID=2714933 RepID=A0ABX6JZ48_9MICO|nr:winged helix DNA-binding domain-containing protein [Leucobacter coleopterorum]QIM18247.1 winged helix DNA-binding domain-containing protein [Leucobacter coleopterorum]